MNNSQEISILYKNWRNETAWRTIIPMEIWYGSTEWHPQKQWLLKALDVERMDVEKDAERDFAMKDIQQWGDTPL